MRTCLRPASQRQAARLERQFLDGKHTDVVIRVRIADSIAKPPDIKAHSVVLSACSAYFDRALSGDWAEAVERRVELTVDDEQELEDLKLLIKLSYTDSFNRLNGELLPLPTRLRLAVRADALGFVGALDRIVASLPLGMDLDGAFTCMATLPSSLEAHPGMADVLTKAVKMVATSLGPVAGMFEDMMQPIGFDSMLPLRDIVKVLPLPVFRRLLASEALQLQSENEAFILLVAWMEQSPNVTDDAQHLALFKELAPLLRFHHMTTDFLANIVLGSGHVHRSGGLMLPVLHLALVQREASPPALREERAIQGSMNRGVVPSLASWELKATFTLEEVAALQQGARIMKWCGFVAGYLADLYAERKKETDTLALHSFISIPKPFNVPKYTSELEGALSEGVCLHQAWTLPPNIKKTTSRIYGNIAWGWADVFGKPWAEVVREGSSHFP